MLNHAFTLDMSQALASRIPEGTPAVQAKALYQLAYQRLPSQKESQRLEPLLNKGNLKAVCRAILNSSELIYLD